MRRRSGDFTLRQLDTFVCAAHAGSFALAADRLGISQPAVSDHITTLERHLGHRLFDRRRGTTGVLTREGRDMLHRAETLLSTSRTMRPEGGRAPAEARQRMRLAIGNRARDIYLKPALPHIYQDLPHVELTILPTPLASEAAAALDKGEIDLLLCAVGHPPLDLPNMRLLDHLPLRLVAAPAMARRIATGELALDDLSFILPTVRGAGEAWLVRQLTRAGIRPRRPIRHLDFADVIQTMVEDGLGVSILMDERTAPAIAAGRLVPFGPALAPMRQIIARSPRAPRATEAVEQMLLRDGARSGLS